MNLLDKLFASSVVLMAAGALIGSLTVFGIGYGVLLVMTVCIPKT